MSNIDAMRASPQSTQLLSNGRYSVMLSAAGSGFSRWHDLAVTRWRGDATSDVTGTYFYLRDTERARYWSSGYQPCGVEPDAYAVAFADDRVTITRRDDGIESRLDVIVAADDDAEIRRLSLTNTGAGVRELELTSYAEVVLAPAAADTTHPAFSNLFVSTEWVADANALIATRRAQSDQDAPAWLAHGIATADPIRCLQWESDRARFLGRGHGVRAPRSVMHGHALSNTVGSVLDPIVSLRCCLRLGPGETRHAAVSTIVATTRQGVIDLARKYRDPLAFDRAAARAGTHAREVLQSLGLDTDMARRFQRLAAAVFYTNPQLRARPEVLARQAGGQPMLWAHGISGDMPIILATIHDVAGLELARELLQAHAYWRAKGLRVDLVFLNVAQPPADSALQPSLETVVRTSQGAAGEDKTTSSVFTLLGNNVTPAQRDVLESAARAVLSSDQGSLSEQLQRADQPADQPDAGHADPVVRSREPRVRTPSGATGPVVPQLEFFNGMGGFANDGQEYVTVLADGQWTPAPWINVISNATLGCLVSESGSGYTWSCNSQLHQLTPWSNDPVTDQAGEGIYVRDEETGEVWTPTALPIREATGRYVARHGAGYSRFEHQSHEIALDLLQFVPADDTIKISRLTLTNQSGRARRLSVTAYVEWVLGPERGAFAPFVVTELDAATGAVFARNGWSIDFANRVAFADLGGRQRSATGDRTEFLGRDGNAGRPAALAAEHHLTGRTGAGLDPCGALQTTIELPVGGHDEIVFLLGDAASGDQARALLMRYRTADLDACLRSVIARWDATLGTVHVTTPDRSVDLLLNRWLLYQTLACRVWARSAFYQSSGAFGFRDQLQDVMALMVSRPDIAREQVLRAASRQFVEGDVQHWWHPPVGRGVRTRISDDRVWLPYVVTEYLNVTSERAVLDEEIAFLEGPVIPDGHTDAYFEPRESEQRGTLFEHCARALDSSLSLGSHGLPLMGTGDWNDGMNRVGAKGKGESVWLGWFLCTNLSRWAAVAEARGETRRAATWRAHANVLAASIEREAWDGEWYRRAYFDDGQPLGAAMNDECRIDSIVQSWSVLSGAGDIQRARRAMASLDAHLVRRADRLVLLLTPPFEHGALDPGYIKAYLPGVRENGGQYTHAATWPIVAWAELGDGDRAMELFSLLNPITHGATPADVERYMVEPYVLAGDVYSEAPHVGRGGWTWYTGSAGWLYRAGLEWILGFRLRGTELVIDPCIPRTWPGFTIAFRYRSSRYEIVVENPDGVSRGVSSLTVDALPLGGVTRIPIADDGVTHRVRIVLGTSV